MKESTKHQGLRRHLIETLKAKGIQSEAVLSVMLDVPRHFFMDPSLVGYAYEDNAYPISADQTISQPYTVAFQSELLDVSSANKVLEIGTGSGYQTAVLLGLSPQVYTIERQQVLFKQTQRLFLQLGYRPKKHIFGDGYKGLPDAAPFDRIIVTAGAPEVPKPLLNQLAIGGKLVIPIGEKEQIMTRFIRTSKSSFDKEEFGLFRFVPLLENKN
ncbi:MAG: protein-L-isoaspartate(D-aspartate) O-methyltransferase [Flavobacteriaceae bacterium]|jgi:protein-L-isoaspartate(D-aspartate) O-methyltransferase|nr:protein-L-isoaspartate(D-aspartate) O-methyltransferase [Flavobacteriaceae bacterium]MBT4314236.1 protein-L-isoaspartate(D-aspartate) O-methyltransferase [Flavobacteriaceae bacterium]MBT5091646.1 protein-L-isoaspartate(D-aspartate) O-methyltransferase [Flavobacteriaceae bacterium]MBT5283813.1 protein-L-isoaspartate(D-aspartate) O-methyltransferase [Flavobacteriaceae bacterium]MBT5447362.1 protein-L-isoaspartate(D-aspartate) O-methyltransferase [Flavobacteriaceae bacterium]|tara:strand:- start:8971 stop:9612 length:642 start_codon:yes stop_codon:yes gene_type:complete